MILRFQVAVLKEMRWHEYAVRFVAGGIVTAAAHAIVQKWGPIVGGLFLAFPSIFPASATLISRHERRQKERQGQQGRERGILSAALEADGSTLGGIGLAVFGTVVWTLTGRLAPALLLGLATAAWGAVSGLLWICRRRIRRLFLPHRGTGTQPRGTSGR